MEKQITLNVNGKPYTIAVGTGEVLLNVLRDRLHLTGTKYGCGIGECGACTVLLNGRTVLSCQMLAVQADGGEILTIEGLEQNGALDPLQEAFLEEGAVQCGFCTPGMVLTAKELLARNQTPSSEEIKEAIRGNLCRCTGYTNIVRAVQKGAEMMNISNKEQKE
jgi:aerobic carbon-monoxide dehydrogenase small subunit